MPNPLDMVTEDQRDDNPPRRVYIYTNPDAPEGEAMLPAGGNKLTQAVAPEQPSDLMANIAKLRDYVAQFGTGILDQLGVAGMQPGPKRDAAVTGRNAMVGIGDEQDLPWPQRMIRSGATLPGDVASGEQPVVDPFTGRTSGRLIERTQDLAGLAGGGALTERPGVASLGSGPVRPAMKPTEPAPVFYSALEHAVENSAQNTATPEQWAGFLKNTPGVKAEEIQWTGIGDWLASQKGKVSKDDVKAYLDEHKVELKDVTKQEQTWDRLSPRERERVTEDFHEYEPDNNDPAAIRRFYDDARGEGEYEQSDIGGDTKYSSYQLLGGENYREHLLTLPSKGKPVTEAHQQLLGEINRRYPETYHNIIEGKVTPDEIAGLERKGIASEEEVADLQKAVASNKSMGQAYRSSHWDEPNVLAHVRTNDRFMPRTPDPEAAAAHAKDMQQFRDKYNAINDELKNKPGWPASVARDPRVAALEKEYGVPDNATPAQLEAWERGAGDTKPVKSLHIEEIQSDWHQQGRKQGYKDPIPEKDRPAAIEKVHELEDKMENMVRQGKHVVGEYGKDLKPAPEYVALQEERAKLIARIKNHEGVPDAPFKTTWPELALKRMIRHAAENGYDRISWTPGEAQAARYDLSKTIDRVLWSPEGKKFMAFDKNGKVVIEKHVEAKDLPDVIGKDAADKLINKPTRIDDLGKAKMHSLENADLKVGGEGMREFYDKMLPKMAEKIGKAHGVKVKIANLPEATRLSNKIGEAPIEQPVHYFDLPKSLREHAVGKGFPLYMAGIPFPLTSVDRDPFKKKDKK